MFNKWITKKNIFLVSSIGPIVYIIGEFYFKICTYGTGCEKYFDIISFLALPQLVFLPFFFFSLITYKMRDEVFQAWIKYAMWWVPLTIFVTLIASDERSQSLPMPSARGLVDIGMSFLFVVLSIIIIMTKRASLRKKM